MGNRLALARQTDRKTPPRVGCWFATCAIALSTTWLAACEPPPAPPAIDAELSTDTQLPPCSQTAELFALTVNGQVRDLVPGSQLPLVLGFQGFIFVRVGLRSQALLPSTVKVRLQVQVPGLVDTATGSMGVKTLVDGQSWVTRDIAFFFNDVPFAELAGRPASLAMALDTPTCRLTATAAVVLEDGGVMGADAALWGTLD